MENEPKLVTGAMVTFSIAVVALVLMIRTRKVEG